MNEFWKNKLTIKISDIAAYGNYFYQGKNNSDSSAKFEAYTAALDELYSCVINQNEQYEALSKALKEQLRDVRACISVNGQTIVDVVNQLASKGVDKMTTREKYLFRELANEGKLPGVKKSSW